MDASVSLNLNNSNFAKGVQDSKKHAQDFGKVLERVSDTLAKWFEREPIGTRRGGHAFTELAKNLISTQSGATNAGEAISGMVGALSFSLPAKAGLGVAAAAIAAIATEGQRAKSSVHEITREGLRLSKEVDWETPASGIDELVGRSRRLHENLRKNTDEARKFSESLHPVSGVLRRLYSGASGALTGVNKPGLLPPIGGAVVSGLKGQLFPPELKSLTDDQLRKSKEIAKIREDITKSAQDDLDISRERVEGDRFDAAILKDQKDTEANISRLKGFGSDQLRQASLYRQEELRAQQALVKLDIAAEFHKAQIERPGIGLTGQQVSGAQLFRRRSDAQEQLRLSLNPEARARAQVSLDQVRNEIESAEYTQYRRDIGVSGSQTSSRRFGGGSATWGEQRTAARRKRAMDLIRGNPALKSQLDTELGVNFSGLAPGQTKPMPDSSKGSNDITGGRTLGDLYNLIEQKWQ